MNDSVEEWKAGFPAVSALMGASDEALKKPLIEGKHKVRCNWGSAPNTLLLVARPALRDSVDGGVAPGLAIRVEKNWPKSLFWRRTRCREPENSGLGCPDKTNKENQPSRDWLPQGTAPEPRVAKQCESRPKGRAVGLVQRYKPFKMNQKESPKRSSDRKEG